MDWPNWQNQNGHKKFRLFLATTSTRPFPYRSHPPFHPNKIPNPQNWFSAIDPTGPSSFLLHNEMKERSVHNKVTHATREELPPHAAAVKACCPRQHHRTKERPHPRHLQPARAAAHDRMPRPPAEPSQLTTGFRNLPKPSRSWQPQSTIGHRLRLQV